MFARAFRYLIGWDVFISYSRDGGLEYAQRLRDQLIARHPGVSVFSDWTSSPVGASLPLELLRALRRSRRMVLIVTEKTARSEFVKREVDTFVIPPRPIIPVIAAGVDRPLWSGLEGAVWVQETAGAFAPENPQPSGHVLARIREAIGADTQSRRTTRAAAGALIAVLSAAVLSAALILPAQSERDEAIKARETAVRETKTQEQLAVSAEIRRNAADAQRVLAEAAKRKADEQAARQREISDATSLVNQAETLLRQERHHLQRATLLAAEAMRRFDRLGMRSAAADLALRDSLARTGIINRRVPFTLTDGLRAVSKDGRHVAAFDGSRVELIDLDTNKRRTLLLTRDRQPDLKSFDFSDDGSHLIAAAVTHATGKSWIGIWRVSDGAGVGPSIAHDKPLHAVAITGDGSHYAAWIDDVVRVWNTATHLQSSADLRNEKGITSIRGYRGQLRFSPTSRYLAVAGGSAARMWEWRTTPAENDRYAYQIPPGNKLAFSEDEQTLIIGGSREVTAIALPDRERRWFETLPRMGEAEFGDLAVDGESVAYIRAHTIEVRSIANHQLIQTVLVQDPSRIAFQGYSAGGRERLGVLCADGAARLYEYSPENRELAYVAHPRRGEAMAFRDDGAMVSLSSDESLVWNIDTHGVDAAWTRFTPHTRNIDSAPDSTRFVATGYGKNENDERIFYLCIRDAVTADEFGCQSALGLESALAYGNHGVIAAGTKEGSVYVWEYGSRIAALSPGFGSAVAHVAVSPSSRLVAATSGSLIFVWDRSKSGGKPVPIKTRSAVRALIFTNEDELATLDSDERLRLWRWSGTTRVRTAAVRVPGPWQLKFTTDGRVATVDGDHVLLSDRNGRLTERIDHGSAVNEITTTSNCLLVSSGSDGLIRFWQLHANAPATEISRVRAKSSGEYLYDFAVSADSRYLLRLFHQDVRMELLAPQDLLAFVCRRLASTSAGKAAYQRACTPECSASVAPFSSVSFRNLGQPTATSGVIGRSLWLCGSSATRCFTLPLRRIHARAARVGISRAQLLTVRDLGMSPLTATSWQCSSFVARPTQWPSFPRPSSATPPSHPTSPTSTCSSSPRRTE